ncbi:MAG: TetR/AcrR family transcriptional regulator [Candidatus Saliniplasma sp.]
MPSGRCNKKEELVKAAERSFSEKGYSNTSVDDICEEVGVAHGLFYYYFETKEDIIDAITKKMIHELENMLAEVVDDPDLRADEKFIKFMTGAFQSKKDKTYLVSHYNQQNDPKVYYKLFNRTVEVTTPYLTDIVEQGIEEGVFHTKYPEQTIRFWLNGRMFFMDEEGTIDEGLLDDLKAEAFMLERLLGAEKPFLTEFYERYEDEIKEFIESAEGDD